MAKLTKEQLDRNTAREALLLALREARNALQAKAPGQPCVEIPLDKIHTFVDGDGTPRAVIGVEQVIYLADEILRR
jgi:hypothetical protein